MIIRLLLCLLLLVRRTSQRKLSGCSPRVDILDAGDLIKPVEVLLTEKSTTPDAKECAIECYKNRCDVAYYNEGTQQCQYRSFTTLASPLPFVCKNIVAFREEDVIEELNTIERYCIECRDNTAQPVEESPFSLDEKLPGQAMEKLLPLQSQLFDIAIPLRPMSAPEQFQTLSQSLDGNSIEPLPERTPTFGRSFQEDRIHMPHEQAMRPPGLSFRRQNDLFQKRRRLFRGISFKKDSSSNTAHRRDYRIMKIKRRSWGNA